MLKGMKVFIALLCVFFCGRAFGQQTTAETYDDFTREIQNPNFNILLLQPSYEWGARSAILESGQITGSQSILTPNLLITRVEGAFKIASQNTVSFYGDLQFNGFNLTALNDDNGGIFFIENSILNFNGNFTFDNNQAQENGGTVYSQNSKINFESSTILFSNNTTRVDDDVDDKENGGAIFLNNSTMNFTNTNIVFSENQAMSGGAIYAENSDINFTGRQIDFIDNTASAADDASDNPKSGGAIFVKGSSINFSNADVNFIGNRALTGGAIYSEYSNIKFVNAKVNFLENIGRISAINFKGNERMTQPQESPYSLDFIRSSVSFIGNISNNNSDIISVSHYAIMNFIDSDVFFINNKGIAISFDSERVEFKAIDKDIEVVFKGNSAPVVSPRIFRADTPTDPSDPSDPSDTSIPLNDVSVIGRNSKLIFNASSGRTIFLKNGIRSINARGNGAIMKTGSGSLIFDGDMSFSAIPLEIREGAVIFKSPYNEIDSVIVSSFSVLSLAENGYGILGTLYLDLKENSILSLDADFTPQSLSSDKILSTATVRIDNAVLIINEINMISWKRGKNIALLYSNNPFTYNFSYDSYLYQLYYKSNTSFLVPNTDYEPIGPYALWAKYIGPQYLIEEAAFFTGIMRTFVSRDPRDKVYPKIKISDLSHSSTTLEVISKTFWGQISVDGINIDVDHISYFKSAAYDLSAGALFIDREKYKAGFFLSGGYERFSQINNDALANNAEIGLYGAVFPIRNEVRFFAALGHSAVRMHVGDAYADFSVSPTIKLGIEDSFVWSDSIKPYAGLRYSQAFIEWINVEELRMKFNRKTFERLVGYGGVRHERTFNRWFLYAKGELGFLLIDNTESEVHFGHLWDERIKADYDPMTLGIGGGAEFSITQTVRLFSDASVARSISADFTHYNAQIGIRIALPIFKTDEERKADEQRRERKRLEKIAKEEEKARQALEPEPVFVPEPEPVFVPEPEPEPEPETKVRIVRQIIVLDENEVLKAIEDMPQARQGYVSVIALVKRDKGSIWITMLEFKADEFIKNDYQFDAQTQRQLDEKIKEFADQGVIVGDMRAVYNGPEISEQDVWALRVKTDEIYRKLKDKEAETFKGGVDNEKIDEALQRRGQALMSYRIQAASFLFSSAQLSTAAKENIKRMAEEIRAQEYKKVIVEGHTCTIGDIGINLIISMRRARSVQKELIANGIPEENIDCIGFGPSMPIEDNKTREGRAANRRVEIFVE